MENQDKLEMDVIHKEIDLIQSCITRMAGCSFNLKEWYISLASVVATLLIGQECDIFIIGIFLLVITTVFWGLDGFFLKTETLYRWKYEWVIKERRKNNDEFLYDLNPTNKSMWIGAEKKCDCLFKYIFSKTLIPLYGAGWGIAATMLVYARLY